MIQCWCYWILGQISDSPPELARYSGIYKATQSLGAAAAWSLNAYGLNDVTQIIIGGSICLIATACAFPVAVSMRESGIDHNISPIKEIIVEPSTSAASPDIVQEVAPLMGDR